MPVSIHELEKLETVDPAMPFDHEVASILEFACGITLPNCYKQWPDGLLITWNEFIRDQQPVAGTTLGTLSVRWLQWRLWQNASR